MTVDVILKNKKALFNYEIIQNYTVGIELFGHEVKSIKKKTFSFEGAFVIVKNGELYLKGMNITPYQIANHPKEHSPIRDRKLLLNKKEISEIIEQKKGKGLTLVPIELYNSNNKIKLRIALVRGKKSHDKRETIKKRDQERDIGRTLKG